MKVVFCDVDGVLNCESTKDASPNGYTGVSNRLVRNLKKIIDVTGADLVLSSDWRLVKDNLYNGKDYEYLVKKLRMIGGLEIKDHTIDISWNKRGLEIRTYLHDHPEVEEFVILDDLPFSDFGRNKLLENLVLTNSKYGLTAEDVKRAIRILQGEKVLPCMVEEVY